MSEPSENLPGVKQAQRKRWLIRLSLLFLVIAIIYIVYYIFIARFEEITDDAYVSGNLIQVMPQISGHVTAILADETDFVKKDQALIYLDKADAEIKLKNAETHLALVVRQVRELYNNVDQLKANVVLQQANLLKAKSDYQRRNNLVINKYVSSEEVQHAKAALDGATASLDLAKSQLSAAIALVENSSLYQHPQVQQAVVEVRNAYLNAQRTIIYAATAGYIAKRPVVIGQEVTPNTILMIIVPLNEVWVDANYKESQLEHIRIGQPVEVVADAYGSSVTFKGRVVGLNPGAGNAFDLLPPQNATGNWIKVVQRLPVRISLDAKQLEKYPLRIGLSVTVTVDTHEREGQVLSVLSKTNVIYQSKDSANDLKDADQIINKILRENAADVSYVSPR